MTQKEILPAVSAVVFNERGEILLQRRKDTGKWCIISGHVEFGETVQEAILREVLEETGVRSEIVRLIGVYSDPPYATYKYPERTVHYVVTYFEVRLLGKIEDGLTNSESEEFAYFAGDQLPELDLVNPNWLVDALDPALNVFIR
ncbi:NUDIX domain-containing protein [Chryseolinea sp. H1M3-3]|uniref:NUDIX domain-containing protein n=1 Tax=Chryseolinea sp. H1M3-3 TaxID=3034144 RepID=UPI0023EC2585|nr:NUDIX domain-containing protein [Chryseolinea sp. H1M3-3]